MSPQRPNLVALLVPLVLGIAVAVHAVPTHQNGRYWGMHQARAAYFMTNDLSNAIVALPIGSDGSLSAGTKTPTGGNGGSAINPMTGATNGPDALGSQGAVQVVDNLLFAVNPGSNSVSAFRISYQDPTQVTLLGSPVSSGGDFPVSLAVSDELQLACVANTGALSGVSCATFDPDSGLGPFDALRSIPLGQSTPPTGPANSIAQVLFSVDSSSLITIVKGNGSTTDPGFIAVYPVEKSSSCGIHASVSTEPSIKTAIASAPFLFGSTTIPGTDNLLISDATFGSVIVSLDNPATPLALTNITDQMATCWATVSPFTDTGFVDDVLVSHLVEVDLTTGAIVSEVPCDNDGQGMIDLVSTGTWIYALSPGNGTVDAAVTVFSVAGGRGSVKAVQNFVVSGVGRAAEGMAVF